MHEVKSADDIAGAFDEFMLTFEAFKSANDCRLTEIERRAGDPLTAQKVERISRTLDDLSLRMSRPQIATTQSPSVRSPVSVQHKAAFDAYVRKGEPASLRDIEGKALSATSDPDGGYLVPEETERTVNASLRAISPIRAIAGVRQVSSSVYKKPFSVTGFGTGWVGDAAARPETATPTLAELALAPRDFWAMTPRELDAALRGRLGLSGSMSQIDRAALDTLMRRFPDRRAASAPRAI
jgi:HK97 family phage major capsid protein